MRLKNLELLNFALGPVFIDHPVFYYYELVTWTD